MKRDYSGLFNIIIGTLLSFVAGWYAAALPGFVIAIVGLSGAFLIFRECWVYGGETKNAHGKRPT